MCIRVLDVSKSVVITDVDTGKDMEVTGATGRGLYKYVKDFLHGELRIMTKVKGLCTDGASAVYRKTTDDNDTSISMGSEWLRDEELDLRHHNWCLGHRVSLLLGDCLSRMPR